MVGENLLRGIYQNYEKELESNNFFNHNNKMKTSWYDGTTGLEPLDFSIKNALTYGWTHHIERLMILCNIMNLCQLNPKEVFKWFMEMFIDSSEWVMSPNVYGMGYLVMVVYLLQNRIYVAHHIF